VISPARIESTIRTFSSAGNTGGLAMTIRLLDRQTRKKRALPQSLTRDSQRRVAQRCPEVEA